MILSYSTLIILISHTLIPISNYFYISYSYSCSKFLISPTTLSYISSHSLLLIFLHIPYSMPYLIFLHIPYSMPYLIFLHIPYSMPYLIFLHIPYSMPYLIFLHIPYSMPYLIFLHIPYSILRILL